EPDAAARLRSRGGEADQDAARERDAATGQEAARETFPQEEAGEERDQERSGVDDHGGCAGVDVTLGGVERHAVSAEEENAEGGDRRERRVWGQPLAAGERDAGEDRCRD